MKAAGILFKPWSHDTLIYMSHLGYLTKIYKTAIDSGSKPSYLDCLFCIEIVIREFWFLAEKNYRCENCLQGSEMDLNDIQSMKIHM